MLIQGSANDPTAGASPLAAREERRRSMERACRERGLPLGPRRLAIIRVLSEMNDQPDCHEIRARVSAIVPDVHISTVYRTLGLFEAAGLIRARRFGDERTRYEPADGGRHYRLVDVQTGQVHEFTDPAVDAAIREVALDLGYQVVDCRLEILVRRDREASITRGRR